MKLQCTLFNSTETIFYIAKDLTKSCNFTLTGEWEKYKGAKSLIYHNEQSKTSTKTNKLRIFHTFLFKNTEKKLEELKVVGIKEDMG